MSSIFALVLKSPHLLYTTSFSSFIIARLIIYRVQKKGRVSFAPTLTKYNSRIYAFSSLILCIAILVSFWEEIVDTPSVSLRSIICSQSTSSYDETLRYIYHASKFYEYIDIFNVLAAGSTVNAHFGIHHFTTPYLTYAREIKQPAGWKIFAGLNTFHHALMYAYFGGATVFTDIIEWTGGLQLTVGIFAELYAIWKNLGDGPGGCGGPDKLWTNVLALVLFSTYFFLFWGDLRMRWKRTSEKKEQ